MANNTTPAFLGIELGSTRIKAVLIDGAHKTLAQGNYDWENRFENGIWTYPLDEVWKGLQAAYASLAADYGKSPAPAAIGISAMMHGYLVFDNTDRLLTPFRTWRNTITEEAAAALTKEFAFNVPQRWSAAHLYQALLKNEAHCKDIAFMTTLAGYIHYRLTGKKTLGIGDASGMFPINSTTLDYDSAMLEKFDNLAKARAPITWKIKDIMPKVMTAGNNGGALTKEGALLLDPSGALKEGVPLCPPEGDAGTGMAATNACAVKRGNVSAGTSIFAMIVLEKPLSRVWTELDIVSTPDGKPAAMVHCNNCTGDLDAWARLFMEVIDAAGGKIAKKDFYDIFYNAALKGDATSGLLSYNYFSGEPVAGVDDGLPLFVRSKDSVFNFANFASCQLFSIMGALKIGFDILTEKEGVKVETLLGHGGFFKTKRAGQEIMAGALDIPVEVLESAGEGGAWGIALLASFMAQKAANETLDGYLADKVFKSLGKISVSPDKKIKDSFAEFFKRYTKGIAIEKAACECF